MDVSAYLRRIRFDATPRVDLDTLRALHIAHLEAVPFENLDIHLGRRIVLDEAAFFDKIVRRGRGGFCFELNGLFRALLRSIGFRVTMLAAGVRRAHDSYSPEFDHMTLVVELDERWLADVGFGDSFRAPLRLDDPGEQTRDGRSYRVTHDGVRGTMSGRSDGAHGAFDQGGRVVGEEKGYRFTLSPRTLVDYNTRCDFLQTSPESVFTQRIICSRATPSGRLTIANQRLVVTDRGVRDERELGEPEWREALTEHFGIPADDARMLRPVAAAAS